MTVAEFIITIKQRSDYYPSSLILKSSDNNGCLYKFLVNCGSYASRQEIFIQLDPEESELELINKTVISNIDVYPAK
jgi:hypothetical protein